MKNYSTEIVAAIQEHLDDIGMKLVAFDENRGSFGFVMHLSGQFSFIHFIIRVHAEDYTVTATCPVSPDADDRAALTAMAEFICRANYGLRNGNFELDFRDGEICYKSFVDCDGQLPSRNIISDSIATPAAMMDMYAEGIIDVLYKGVDAEMAVRKCELRRKLEEARRKAARRRSEANDTESDQDGESVVGSSGSFPSYEEFLKTYSEDDESDAFAESDTDDTEDDE